jgi:hypothetical protein
MLSNAVFVATLIFLALIVWLSGELRFLAPWRSLILHSYLKSIALYCNAVRQHPRHRHLDRTQVLPP